MRVLIGGGTGFVGKHLSRMLEHNGFRVTSISRKKGPERVTWEEIEKQGLPEDCTAVVNLAGRNILDPGSRWTDSFKQEVWSSRIDSNKRLAKAIKSASKPPSVFVTVSGVSYYAPSPTAEYTEESKGGDSDWLATLAKKWEEAGNLPESTDVRRVVIRSGVVLGRDGGMIQQITYPFYLGLGGKIGSGQQWFPWIHINDIAGLFTYAIMNDHVSGVLNGVAPEAATNADFTKAYTGALMRPGIIPVPSFVMNLAYGPTRAKMILEGQKVIPKRTLESGYKYIYPDLKSACKEFAHL